jgi:hypothetical protein
MRKREECLNIINDVINTSKNIGIELEFTHCKIVILTPINAGLPGSDLDIDSSGNVCVPSCSVDFNNFEPEFEINFGSKTDVNEPTFNDFNRWIEMFR